MRTLPFYVPYSFRKVMQVVEAQRHRVRFICRVPSQGTFCDVKTIYHFCCSTCYKTSLSSASTKYCQLFAHNAGDEHRTFAAAAERHKGRCLKQALYLPILHLGNIHANASYDKLSNKTKHYNLAESGQPVLSKNESVASR